jgi:hypothetical protein
MSYLKLLSLCHVLSLEEQGRKEEERQRKVDEFTQGAGERFRKGQM